MDITGEQLLVCKAESVTEKKLKVVDLRNFSLEFEIDEPRICFFKDNQTEVPNDWNGLYVVFERDINRFDLRKDTEKNGCIYVGHGHIRTRLRTHQLNSRFSDAGCVVFYRVEDPLERRLFERVLISYYRPVFNKEGESQIESVRMHADKEKSFLARFKG